MIFNIVFGIWVSSIFIIAGFAIYSAKISSKYADKLSLETINLLKYYLQINFWALVIFFIILTIMVIISKFV